ncbi:MAG: glycosyltransferase [Actinobacteria bacterium]|nr:glycosyltransferase [Actinomycetota bacterium]
MTDQPDPPQRLRFPRASCDVSVALCTRNGAQWIREMLDSLASQSRLPDELVVADDHSDDATMSIIAEFAQHAPFVVHIETNETPVGSTMNFASALARCGGRFIALADQDDVWYPSKLACLVGEMEQDPTITMAFSDAELIDEDGVVIGSSLWDARLVGCTLRRRPVVAEELFARRALTTGCTMAVRRRAVAAALPFPDELLDDVAPMRHDRWLSLVAAAVGTVRAIPEPLLGFRVHPAQETGVLLGRQLHRAMSRAVTGVLRASTDDDRGYRVRAVQLEVAADRAEDLGDFEEAATLRGVAAHLRRRVDVSEPVGRRLRSVMSDVNAGVYGWDRLGITAAGADIARALLRPARAVEPAGRLG